MFASVTLPISKSLVDKACLLTRTYTVLRRVITAITTHTHTPVMPECEQMLDDVIMAPRDTLVTRQRLTKGGPEFGDQRGPDTR